MKLKKRKEKKIAGSDFRLSGFRVLSRDDILLISVVT